MPREANAIDFWRGFALVSIFVNHIPGIWYERLTHRNLSISDSAELFVFLAGWSLGLLVGSRDAQQSTRRCWCFRLGGRALQIYAAQILISSTRARHAGCRRLTPTTRSFSSGTTRPPSSTTRRTRRSASCCSRISSAISTSCRSMSCSCWWRPPSPLIDRFARPLLVPLSLALYFASLTCRSRRRPGRSTGSGSSIRSPGRRSSCSALPCRATKGSARLCAATSMASGMLHCPIVRGLGHPGLVQLVSRPDQAAGAEAAVPQRQELPDADAAPAVPGAGGGVFRRPIPLSRRRCPGSRNFCRVWGATRSTSFVWDRC